MTEYCGSCLHQKSDLTTGNLRGVPLTQHSTSAGQNGKYCWRKTHRHSQRRARRIRACPFAGFMYPADFWMHH